LTDRFCAAAAGETDARCAKKNMQAHFSFLGDDHNDSAATGDALKEAAALYLDPRNRLLAQGPDALTDADTLSLLLGERDHLLATRLLLDFGSLTALSRASLVQLLPFLNREKAMRLIAAFRLAALCSIQQAPKVRIDGPESIYDLFVGELIQSDREILAAALVDNRLRLIKKVRISIGTLNEALAHPREILKPAISHSAHAFALVHNHPSGDPAPSDADHRLTRRIHEASAILQIQFIDHVIIGQRLNGNPPYFSFKEAGLLA
jgi:DNA repair protein RadC